MTERSQKPLWPCPACGRTFARANQSHACGRHDLESHFAGKPPLVRDIYEAFLAMLEDIGPVTVLPEKTRIAFHVRMSFAQLTVRRNRVLGHFVLARRVEDPVFTKVETISPRNHVHHFRLQAPGQVAALCDFAREAFAVGRQEHVGGGGPSAL
ncbi:MAG TPA: DUF5655 domain-containing protein [Allosphingosinicella sp.]|nr:DUF5655 domain-containing protein [Allosphingosinicella sp.]